MFCVHGVSEGQMDSQMTILGYTPNFLFFGAIRIQKVKHTFNIVFLFSCEDIFPLAFFVLYSETLENFFKWYG